MNYRFRAVKRGAHYIGVIAGTLDGPRVVALASTARKHPTWQRAFDDARYIVRKLRREDREKELVGA